MWYFFSMSNYAVTRIRTIIWILSNQRPKFIIEYLYWILRCIPMLKYLISIFPKDSLSSWCFKSSLALGYRPDNFAEWLPIYKELYRENYLDKFLRINLKKIILVLYNQEDIPRFNKTISPPDDTPSWWKKVMQPQRLICVHGILWMVIPSHYSF